MYPKKKYNTDRIKAFVGEDQEMIQKMVMIFLENGPKMLASIKECLSKKDYKSLAFNAHKLKTSIDHFSIETLTKEIRQIEKYANEKSEFERLPVLIQKLESELLDTMKEIRSDFI